MLFAQQAQSQKSLTLVAHTADVARFFRDNSDINHRSDGWRDKLSELSAHFSECIKNNSLNLDAQVIENRNNCGGYNVLLPLMAIFEHSGITADELCKAYPSMYRAFDLMLSNEKLSAFTAGVMWSNGFGLNIEGKGNVTMGELSATLPISSQIVAIASARKEIEATQRAAAMAAEADRAKKTLLDEAITKINACSTTAKSIQGLEFFFKNDKYDAIRDTLMIKMKTKFLMSLNEGGANHDAFLAAYSKEVGMFSLNKNFLKVAKYQGKTVAEVILDERNNASNAAQKAFVKMTSPDEHGILLIANDHEVGIREEIHMLSTTMAAAATASTLK